MLRWIALLLLLSNALLLFWYGQQHQAKPVRPADPELTRLLLLHELEAGRRLQTRERQCYRIGSFMVASEVARAQARLEREGFGVERVSAPARVLGYQLRLAIPADEATRVQLLDELALAGWVPQVDRADLVLGPFVGAGANQQAATERRALVRVLKRDIRQAAIPDPNPGIDLIASLPKEKEMSVKLRRSLLSGWPGIKIEKKVCERVAHPQSDQ